MTNPKTKTEHTVRFIIVEGDYVPLLGANAAQKMSLLTVNYANILDANFDKACDSATSSPSLKDAVPETMPSCQPPQRPHSVQQI